LVKNGDVSSHGFTIEIVVEKYEGFVQRRLRRLRVPHGELADVAQKVFLGVSKRLHAFTPEPGKSADEAMTGWLALLCAYRAVEHHRAGARRGETLLSTEELEAIAGYAVTTEELLSTSERWDTAQKLIQGLAPRRRAVYVGFEIEGRSIAEIASEHGIPVATARNHLRLARQDLQAAVRRLPAHESRGVVLVLGLFFNETRGLARFETDTTGARRARRQGLVAAFAAVFAMLAGLVVGWHRPAAVGWEPPASAAQVAVGGAVEAANAIDSRAGVPAVPAPPIAATLPAASQLPAMKRPPAGPGTKAGSRAPVAAQRNGLAYFEEARDMLLADRANAVGWALSAHAAGFADEALAPERAALSTRSLRATP
jgi:RNA polymerase sigma-70 factor (ECF subfamily)